jgi:hypothetical protein
MTYPKCNVSKCAVTTSVPPHAINPGVEIFNAGVWSYFEVNVSLYMG